MEDIPPLPPLYTPVENISAKELLLLTALTLMSLGGDRPMGINTDNLAADFAVIATCFEAALPPGMVMHKVSPFRG